jgi:Helix-turn-helix domain/RodZ C-terminal domain
MIRRWISPKISDKGPATAGFDSFDLRLGDVMRGERATLGKSLLDVQRELKIKATFISAIENADVKAFETPSFIAGYVRSYARYLGLDPEWAFEGFCRESGFRPTHGLAPQVKTAPEKAAAPIGDPLANPNASFVPRPASIFEGIEPGAVGSVAVLVALVGVLGFGGWTLLKEIQKVDFAPVEQAVGVMEELPALGETLTLPGLEMADGTETGGMTPPSREALDRLYRPEALDVPVLIARDGPISTLDPSEVGVLAEAGSTAPGRPALGEAPGRDGIDALVAEAAGAAAPGAVRVFGPDAPEVALFAVRPSWVRVQSADGSVILEKILDAGEQYVLPRMESAPILRTGNAGSVYFAVNGTAYGPAGEGASVVKNIALAPQALSESFAVADLSADQDLANFVAVAQAEQQ